MTETRLCTSTAHSGPNPPLSGFGKDKTQPDGLSRRCRECAREQVARWRRDNPERDRLIRARSMRTERLAA